MSLLKPAKKKIEIGSWAVTHGLSKTHAYRSWACMLQRCTNSKNTHFKYYGGRGITVCESWKSFENFYSDMGDRPEGMSLDRIDSNKGYYADNCRWSTNKEQQRNRRDTRKITLNGQTKPLKEWADSCGVDTKTILMRVKRKWPEDLICSTPGNKSNSVARSNVKRQRDSYGKFRSQA